MTVAPDGTDARLLAGTSVGDGDPSWSFDGSRMAFARQQDGIVVVDAADQVASRHAPRPDGGDPAWSVNDELALASERNSEDRQVYRWPLEGDATPLRAASVAATEHDPTWSPGGSKIAFASRLDTNGQRSDEEIVVWDDQTGQVSPLTDNDAADRDPGWSPDGESIVFASNREGNWDIWKMQADGSQSSN